MKTLSSPRTKTTVPIIAALLVMLLVTPCPTCFAFLLTTPTKNYVISTTRHFPLHMVGSPTPSSDKNGSGNGGSDDEPTPLVNFDVESARKQLELLLGNDGNDNDGASLETSEKGKSSLSTTTAASSWSEESSGMSLLRSVMDGTADMPPPPPLSTIERDRRTAELHLLNQLEYSDDSTSQLWELWYSERGVTAQSLLQEADRLTGDPTSWSEVESILTKLIDKYGVYFAEPINRLATLYFLQGRLEESYKLCLIVLKVKPWHFGALSGIVQVCIGMGDRNAARVWAEKRLPNIASGTSFTTAMDGGPINPRRQEWVDRAVANAKDLLQQAELQTKTTFFGEPETYYQQRSNGTNSGNFNNIIMDQEQQDGGAWQ